MNETFMKEKPVFPLISSMALPMVLSMLVNSLYNIVDSFFVAQISEKAMTALSLVYPVQNLINAAAIGFGVGINAVAAFYLGAGNKEKAGSAAAHGLLFSAVHGILITVGALLIMPTFLKMFTADSEIIHLGLQYSNIAFSFSLIIMLSLSFEKIFQAAGRMKTTMASLLCGCIANIILDPLMIFGIGFFPEMGIRGAALATGIGQVLTVAVYLAACALFPLPMPIGRTSLSPDRSISQKIYAVGIPAALNLALPSLLISCLNGLLAVYSESYVVILGIYYKLQTFLYLPASGVVQGMRPVIGYNYGAGESERVRKIYRVTLGMCLIIMDRHLSRCPLSLNCSFYRQSQYHTGRWRRPSHHQRRFYRIRCLCHIIRGFRRSGERVFLLDYFSDAVCNCHSARCLDSQPAFWTYRRMECVLDYRSRHSGCLGCNLVLCVFPPKGPIKVQSSIPESSIRTVP